MFSLQFIGSVPTTTCVLPASNVAEMHYALVTRLVCVQSAKPLLRRVKVAACLRAIEFTK